MITTPRLLLRSWRESDLAPFAAMNADPDVRRYFPGVQTEEESNTSARRIQTHDEKHGFTFWAAELLDTREFIGFTGVIVPDEELSLPDGCLEIGWRLASKHWGRGLATEAANACLEYAFRELKAPSVGAITTVTNAPSINVMKKLSMTYRFSFMHPMIDAADPIAPHVFYDIERPRAGSDEVGL